MSSVMRRNIQTSLGLAVDHEETEMKRVEPQRGGAGRGGYIRAARCGLWQPQGTKGNLPMSLASGGLYSSCPETSTPHPSKPALRNHLLEDRNNRQDIVCLLIPPCVLHFNRGNGFISDLLKTVPLLEILKRNLNENKHNMGNDTCLKVSLILALHSWNIR